MNTALAQKVTQRKKVVRRSFQFNKSIKQRASKQVDKILQALHEVQEIESGASEAITFDQFLSLMQNNLPIHVVPKNANSRWVALDINNNTISEGLTPNETLASAKLLKQDEDLFLMFIPI